MPNLLQKVFGSHNDRVLKKIFPLVDRINQLEPEYVSFSDEALRGRTAAYRERLGNGEPLDDLLPEAFASVREAAKRTLGQRHYDVQLVGGVVLHRGIIAEMKTGEGKTLVATLPAYLNALTGKGVHIVTVNDYLARRDADWMGEVHRFLGLSVGVIVHDISDQERLAAYGSDIAYGTNNELGFDYLRDNMKFNTAQCVQRELSYAIVDEVDSILIDEARTPLIISGPSEQDTRLYSVVNNLIPRLRLGEKGDYNEGIEETGDYWLDEKAHSATLTEAGVHKIETLMRIENLYDPQMIPVLRGEAGRERQEGGHHRRRVHGPPDARSALVRRPPPGRGGEGGDRGPQREPDAGFRDLPEFLPHVREALGHDGYRRHRGAGVREYLRPRRSRDSDQPADDPRRPARRRLQDEAREVQRRDR